ncbi:class F sortase [Streptomyces sp. NPDC052236]|uniref:class F sortase n=1 Tax=Streptomyces sp. NPDC052236 TaxID=3365686 RepID=UPI0037CE76F9
MSRTHQRARWARTARTLAAVVSIGCLGLTGCSADAAGETSADSADSATSGAASRTPSSSSSPSLPASTNATEPADVSIPSIGVKSSLMRLGLNADQTVEVPPAEKGMTAGWYTGGAVPGEPGAAVIIGHNETRFGKAVFQDLGKLTKGADVVVRDAAGKSAHFTVTATEIVKKNAFPTDRVYGATNDRDLRLITCSGAFDSEGHPVDNLIVYATLA